MTRVDAKSKKCGMPEVRVVDGPTWTRFRARSDLEELRVHIEPEWMVTPIWKSPRVGPANSKPMFLSPIVSPPTRLPASSLPPSPLPTNTPPTSSGDVSKVSFIASDIDGFPLLCIMDKDVGTLLLKPMSQLKTPGAVLDDADNNSSGVHILHCRDAAPICEQVYSRPFENRNYNSKGLVIQNSADIVVLEKDGRLMLYRAQYPVCRLVLPYIVPGNSEGIMSGEDESERKMLTSNIQLISIEKGYAYEIVFPYLCGSSSGRIWRCEHPFRIVGSSLLQQVFNVLDCVVPPKVICAFKAQVVYWAQQKGFCVMKDGDFSDSELEWQSFRECIMHLLPKHNSDKRSASSSTAIEESKNDEEMTDAAPSSSSFAVLCQSEFHDLYQYEHAMLFATMDLPTVEPVTSHRENWLGRMRIDELQVMKEYVDLIFAGLHLLCEELKLSITLHQQRLHLTHLLLEMALQLELKPFVTYYREDNCVLKREEFPTKADSGFRAQQNSHDDGLLRFTTYGCVPDVIFWLQSKMTAKVSAAVAFPSLVDSLQPSSLSDVLFRHPEDPLRCTKALCQVYELIFSSSDADLPHLPAPQSNAFRLMVYLTQDPIGAALSLDDLPVGLSFPIVQTIRQVKHHPPPFITEDICSFVGREDLSIASAENLADHLSYSGVAQNQYQHDLEGKVENLTAHTEDESRDDCDGLEEIISRSQPLFPFDQRMKEVARLLRSSRPLCLKLEKTPDLSDLDYAQQQQARLLLLCKRSMALSVARGMVTLGSFDVSTAQTQIWRLRIPALPLAGRKPPTNAVVELDLSGYAKELTYWPQFHNGCATGLRLPAHDLSSVINRHWIKYHRPSVSDTVQRNSPGAAGVRQASASQPGDSSSRNLEEAYAAHAGLLLGIGLRGHLKCLSMADVYNYLSLSNEFVTVAIMLGMASTAAHCRQKRKKQTATVAKTVISDDEGHPTTSLRADSKMPPYEADDFLSGFSELSSSDKTPLLGTGLEMALEQSVSKMLCLHVPSLLPPPFGGFSVPASTQTAALLGLGILYQGTGYRLMTELLLTEIARSPSSPQFVGNNSNAGLSTASFDQLEGYALAAGMALGLVLLGRGQTTTGDPGLADLKLEEKLHKYIVGGAQQFRDTNAAGSCLYRGRRSQAFGSGGSVFNSAVNGGSTGSGTSNNNTGASPGAGRDAKSTSDRSGARGGGEHVNVGVTACASALALAFMYMQTDNKAVAAQLVVPDTLILLDYVRPDILLVRTLAKNLVMWSDISPTMQWIDQHEVPAQLLQAYRSIQPQGNSIRKDTNNGSPSHEDLHSICEAYANIVAGACMSIGLRFAGTSNATARRTLRKYVLHFRELRMKASSSSLILRGNSNVVAAATERATVERCLAVCAQALALVDAGTGNVETLALLRSVTLRQRVDAAMSYGNHMVLTMAIGLLFLGGGRATVSRSKEAVAVLVISLYPMPPMNTADNKYHLQAFRHLYVLAVDTSRLLETVDVNTKTTCAVQVRLDLFPAETRSVNAEDKIQPSHKVLQSPCLLPDMSTIKRLVISNPEFYSIEILTSPSDELASFEKGMMKTANDLRLELLQNKNLVFLKRRQRKDFGGLASFTEELQPLLDAPVGGRGRGDEDRLRILFRSYFSTGYIGDDEDCDDGEDDLGQLGVTDWGNCWWASQLSPRALEHVKDEPQLLMPPYLNILHALFRLQQIPQLVCVTEIVALSLFSEYCHLHQSNSQSIAIDVSSEASSKSETKENKLAEYGVWLSNQTEEALGALWHRTSLVITSLASARIQLLADNITSTSKAYSVTDSFFVSTLMRYFAGPSVASVAIVRQAQLADKDWKAKFQRVLGACSQAKSQVMETTSMPARFQLSAFLEQSELTEAEKTFWLKLVSFFLFSN
ncbi:unnamed protein product [Phytophthora lilii]|uniref:Unnamed protein product n=1 Tax=Phytophthora lilii TaxID=2077276 RepID=A0A9W6TE21_9STRA|nr:unnamed protein product [Phytophthora lilii]